MLISLTQKWSSFDNAGYKLPKDLYNLPSVIEFYENYKVDCEVFNFTDKIIKYYSKSNLVITRSGASVLGELINFKIPFICIPLPTSADNHQYKNAEFYFKKGCGFIVEEKDIDHELYNLIKRIFYEKSLVNNILSNQRQYSDKNIFINLKIHIENILNANLIFKA